MKRLVMIHGLLGHLMAVADKKKASRAPFVSSTVFGILAWRTVAADLGVKFQFRATSLYVQWLSGPSTYLLLTCFCPAPAEKLTVGIIFDSLCGGPALRSLHLTQHEMLFENRFS
jgi:hypothetical protein